MLGKRKSYKYCLCQTIYKDVEHLTIESQCVDRCCVPKFQQSAFDSQNLVKNYNKYEGLSSPGYGKTWTAKFMRAILFHTLWLSLGVRREVSSLTTRIFFFFKVALCLVTLGSAGGKWGRRRFGGWGGGGGWGGYGKGFGGRIFHRHHYIGIPQVYHKYVRKDTISKCILID